MGPNCAHMRTHILCILKDLHVGTFGPTALLLCPRATFGSSPRWTPARRALLPNANKQNTTLIARSGTGVSSDTLAVSWGSELGKPRTLDPPKNVLHPTVLMAVEPPEARVTRAVPNMRPPRTSTLTYRPFPPSPPLRQKVLLAPPDWRHPAPARPGIRPEP